MRLCHEYPKCDLISTMGHFTFNVIGIFVLAFATKRGVQHTVEWGHIILLVRGLGLEERERWKTKARYATSKTCMEINCKFHCLVNPGREVG